LSIKLFHSKIFEESGDNIFLSVSRKISTSYGNKMTDKRIKYKNYTKQRLVYYYEDISSDFSHNVFLQEIQLYSEGIFGPIDLFQSSPRNF
jgi:predicted transcriptional regulator